MLKIIQPSSLYTQEKTKQQLLNIICAAVTLHTNLDDGFSIRYKKNKQTNPKCRKKRGEHTAMHLHTAHIMQRLVY